MGFRRNLLFLLMLLTGIMAFLTYSPADYKYFWLYWLTAFVMFFFGWLMDVLFCENLVFVFDPSFENWKRKTDPRS